MSKQSKIKVVAINNEPMEPIEIIQNSIIALAQGMKKINESRLNEDVIVTLLSRSSNIPRGHVQSILRHLTQLEKLYLKPDPKKQK